MRYFYNALVTLLLALVSTLSLATQQEDAVIKTLKWVDGPRTVNVGSNANFNIPDGYTFLDAPDTRRFIEEVTHNSSSGDEYFFAPKDGSWWATYRYDASGHVTDEEKIDAPALIQSMRSNQEEDNKIRQGKGWPMLLNMDWKYPPFYDPATRRLEWAVSFISSNTNTLSVNFETRLLAREGVTAATLVVRPDKLATALPEFKTAINGYNFISGQRYMEFKQGDRVAEYGLAALVAGGAAAVAAKSGLWKTLLVFLAASWKIAAAGIVALLAGIGKLFKRKESQ